MLKASSYHVKLNKFEGPFDLLLFFIQRDELDINDIPIYKITKDFLDYIHQMEKLNMELASEFILFAAILMKIKSSSILPRKEFDDEGNDVDLKKQLEQRLIEYKKIKNISSLMADMEMDRKKIFSRGNSNIETKRVSGSIMEQLEMESVTPYRLVKAFERVLLRFADRHYPKSHNVVKLFYESKSTRLHLLHITRVDKAIHFEKIFEQTENRVHAIYIFVSLLEMIEEKYLEIIVGSNINDFYVKKKERTTQAEGLK